MKNYMYVYKTENGMIKYHNLFRIFLYNELSKRYSQTEINHFHINLVVTVGTVLAFGYARTVPLFVPLFCCIQFPLYSMCQCLEVS
jgi:hypothetical protein